MRITIVHTLCLKPKALAKNVVDFSTITGQFIRRFMGTWECKYVTQPQCDIACTLDAEFVY